MTSSKAVLRLYKQMLRDAGKFESYNYREYATRRVKEDFHKNKHLTVGSTEQEKALKFAREQAGALHRQSIVSQMYPPVTKSIMDV